MGNFKRNNTRPGGFDRGKRSDSRPGGSGRGRDRATGRFGGSGGRDRDFGRSSGGFGRSSEMFDVTCSKCGKACQVPFKPTGIKPVFCSDCFRQNEGGGSSGFEPRNQDRSFSSPSMSSGSSSIGNSDQLNIINAKLDKIIAVLTDLEIIQDEDSEDSEENSEDDDNEEK
ncbi:MAG: CxxC-x17-CxxC domain-containing protein [Nanoarchaeota archaeon]